MTLLMEVFNKLTKWIKVLVTSCHRLLCDVLKVSIPLLSALPPDRNGRKPLSRAFSVASILANIKMNAEVISAGILRVVIEAHVITVDRVKNQIDTGIGDLLFKCLQVKNIFSKVKILDDNSKTALRKFCLTYCDSRAVILELAFKLDMMRHLYCLPRHSQQMLSIDVMNIYAPLAHALDTHTLSLELEDLSFRNLFPRSYSIVDTWFKLTETAIASLIDGFKEKLLKSLKSDSPLKQMVDDISIHGRYKSRSSTMQKLLKDVRNPEEVNDLVGLRVILNPRSGDGEEACYRTRDVIRHFWREVPERAMDYIARPNANGYKSLHVIVDVNDHSTAIPLMEIQIRTTEMHRIADGGHSLYKGGLTDPEEMWRLKSIVMDVSDLLQLHPRDPSFPTLGGVIEDVGRNGVFLIPDKNKGERISMQQLITVMEEHGAVREDAQVLKYLVDAIGDGSLRSDEFDLFPEQVCIMYNPHGKDKEYENLVRKKLLGSKTFISIFGKPLWDFLVNSFSLILCN